MKNVWVTGYRSYELNVYDEKDPKLTVIKTALRQQLKAYLEEGLEWIITGAQLGVEQWAVQVGLQLKQDYPQLQIAVMLPFLEFGQKWNEKNQAQLQTTILRADFSDSVSRKTYQSPKQLKNYQKFMISHTDSALMIYDPEYPGKSKYDYDAVLHYQLKQNYGLDTIDMYDLEDIARQLSEA